MAIDAVLSKQIRSNRRNELPPSLDKPLLGWPEPESQLGELLVNHVIAEQGIRSFNHSRVTAILSDWCCHGVGHILLQKHCRLGWVKNVKSDQIILLVFSYLY